MNRFAKAIAAAAVLSFLTIGVPIVLWFVAGWPLPSSVPDLGTTAERIRQGDIAAHAVIDTIAVVVWLAWAQLAWSVLWETAVNVPRLSSGRTWRPPPLVLSPVGNGVARLVSVVLAVGVMATATPGGATALSTPSGLGLDPRVPATVGQDAPTVLGAAAEGAVRVDDAPRWKVGPDDDLWSIAETALGDGSLVDDIVRLNPGLTARALAPHMVLKLPAGASGHSVPRVAEGDATPGNTVVPGTPDTAPLAREYEVRDDDGMWNVAEALLGDGSRHVEMAELALGQEVAPGVVFDEDTFVIHAGWVFRLPADAESAADPDSTREVSTYVVRDGDTLSAIADEHLGDPADWTELWETNAERVMHDGRIFDDPHLILPGWELDVATAPDAPSDRTSDNAGGEALPDDLSTIDTHPAGHVDTDASDHTDTDTDTDTGTGTGTGTDSDVPPSKVVDPSMSTPTASPATPRSPTPPSTPQPRVVDGGPAGASEVGADITAPAAPTPIRLEHAALVAAGLLSLLGIRRRRALRAARPHARVPAPPPERVALERRMRVADAAERGARVDIACRAIGGTIVGSGVTIGSIRVAADGELIVRLTGPAQLPTPWVGDEASWTLPAEIAVEELGAMARSMGQPCLALATIGIDADGRDLLVDLEAAGTTVVAAQPTQADDVVRAVGVGLATSDSGEVVHLVTAGLSSECLFDHPNARRASTPSKALELASSLVGPPASDTDRSFDRRVRRTGGDVWEPSVLLLCHGDDAGTALGRCTLPEPASGVAIVAADTTPTLPQESIGARLDAGPDGWTLEAFGERLEFTPVGIDDDDLDLLTDAVTDAGEPAIDDVEMTLVPENWRHAAGGYFVPLPRDLGVGVLGPVGISAADGTPASVERSKTVELIVWLTTNRDRATRSGARTALWDLDVRDATFANVVSEARRGLARLVEPPTGTEWLARTLNESLPMHERVVTDADLVAQRVEHARIAPPAEAIEVLRPAVAMISGMPFAGANYLWPDADGTTSNLVLLATTAACELAGHALSRGDTDLVFWATGQSLKVLPGHEESIALRMRAHARIGDLAGVRSEWESYERIITADTWSDGEPAPQLVALRRELLTAVS
ncbi:MAG: LysM peptidoglycan-binding domain-containing protein [Ilumatobacter sp.]